MNGELIEPEQRFAYRRALNDRQRNIQIQAATSAMLHEVYVLESDVLNSIPSLVISAHQKLEGSLDPLSITDRLTVVNRCIEQLEPEDNPAA